MLLRRYPEYVLRHVSSLPTTEPMKSLKAAVLLFAYCLIKMHNMSAKAFQKEGKNSTDVYLDGLINSISINWLAHKSKSRDLLGVSIYLE